MLRSRQCLLADLHSVFPKAVIGGLSAPGYAIGEFV